MTMRVLVIGAGLIGATSAYFLRLRGHDVTVVDAERGPGLQTSFANGSLLTPSEPEPWNSPGSWKVLLKSIGRTDAALQLRVSALPSLAGWGIDFLRNSAPERFKRSSVANLRLAQRSLEVLNALEKETGIEFGHEKRGTLKFFRERAAFEHSQAWAKELEREGLEYRALSARETAELEPALAPIEGRIAGSIYYPRDETGNAYKFTVGISGKAAAEGAQFRYGVPVTGIEKRPDGSARVRVGNEWIDADAILVAAASHTAPLLEKVGVPVPVRPVKGYSLSFAQNPGPAPLRTAVLDDALHAVVVPLEGGIRVAGTAEFTGFDLSPNEARISNLERLLAQVLPEAGIDPSSGRPWCGLRPMASNGVPIIGRSPIPNLWIATGHGHLGWTMAAGTGEMIADLVSGATPSIDPAPYAYRT